MADSEEEQHQTEEMLLLTLLLKRKRRRRLKASNRNTWTSPWILRRASHGVFANLLKELDAEDPEKFRLFHRLGREHFEEVLSRVAPLIRKEETQMPPSINSRERFSITLRYLATGEQLSSY